MLQQTRVAAALPFYQRFLQRFPTAECLASAPEADLLAQWAGLGYYYRARNLQKAARVIAKLGAFPSDYAGLLALPGIGDYTAAAIASISFGQPYAVVDGNVYRVLSRLYADGTNIASSGARKHFTPLAQELVDPRDPGTFNQAIMELGATVCVPRNPQCLVCPVANFCLASGQGRQAEFPVKTKPRKSVEQTRILYWIEHDRRLLLWERPADSRLMPGFWELPERDQLPDASRGDVLGEFNHAITFHNYRFVIARAKPPAETPFCRWLSSSELATLPLSTVTRKALAAIAATERSTLASSA